MSANSGDDKHTVAMGKEDNNWPLRFWEFSAGSSSAYSTPSACLPGRRCLHLLEALLLEPLKQAGLCNSLA